MSTWISIASQLPDDDICVLIALEDGEVWTGFMAADEWHYVSADLMAAKVTHWCHLPEPPPKATPSKTAINPAAAWPFQCGRIYRAMLAAQDCVSAPRELLVRAAKFMDAAIDEVDTDTIRGELRSAEIECHRLLAAHKEQKT